MAVNRNILVNSAVPLGGGNTVTPPELVLTTTQKSRFVVFNLNNMVESGSGGYCQNIVLEWTPDPSFITNPFQPSSSYYAVTSSVLDCTSASLSPLTASNAYMQKIDADYVWDTGLPTNGPTTYYMRVYQNRTGLNQRIYSPAKSIQVSGVVACGNDNPAAGPAFPPNKWMVADMDGWQVGGFSGWRSNAVEYGGGPWTSSFTTNPVLVKAGGPNNDALLFQSASTMSWPGMQVQSFSGSFTLGTFLVTGSASINFTGARTSQGGGNDPFTLTITAGSATTSGSISLAGRGSSNLLTWSFAPSDYDLRNSQVDFAFANDIATVKINGVQRLDWTHPTILYGNGASTDGGFVWSVEQGTIMRMVYGAYPPSYSIYSCKYGTSGSQSYVG